MNRWARTILSGWIPAARARLRVRERAAATVVAFALVVGPAAALAYGHWVDRGVVTIKAVQWAYLPRTIYAREGVPVRLKIISEDVIHGFAIDGLPVQISELIPGKAEYITFTPEKAGTYHYHCTSYCGGHHGRMFGEVIVTPRR